MVAVVECGVTCGCLGSSLVDQYGDRVIYDATSKRDAHLSNFIFEIGSWQWPCTTWELT